MSDTTSKQEDVIFYSITYFDSQLHYRLHTRAQTLKS